MSRRRARAARAIEERRLADRTLLDAALAPYLQEGEADLGARAEVLDLAAAEAPAQPVVVAEPVVATEPLGEQVRLRVAEGATIDLRRHPGRSSVVRLRRRDDVALTV